jgi:hypothetical protein
MQNLKFQVINLEHLGHLVSKLLPGDFKWINLFGTKISTQFMQLDELSFLQITLRIFLIISLAFIFYYGLIKSRQFFKQKNRSHNEE